MKKYFLFFCLSLCLTTLLFSSTLQFGPYLQFARPDGITVLWETTEPAIGKIVFGSHPNKLSHSAIEDSEKILHQIDLTDLKPNTKYYYQCQWQKETTGIFHFKTAPNKQDTPIRIALAADSRSQPEIFAKICQQLEKYQPDIILHSGDLVAAGNQIEQWKPQFFEPAKSLIANVPIYVTLGNHEQKAGYYFEHFTIHQGEPWWTADYGSVFLIGLNTVEDGSPGSKQYQWLEQQLKKCQDKTWRIVMFHHPLFHVHKTRPVYDFRYDWMPLFLKYNVNLVVTGHDHYYLRTFPIGQLGNPPQAIVHITSAGGGAPLYEVADKPFAANAKSIYHFVILDVTSKKISGTAISIDDEVIDTFEYDKNKAANSDNFFEYEMFVLERDINDAMANLIPEISEGNQLSFKSNFVIKTNFSYPVRGYYFWEIPENWKNVSREMTHLKLNAGDSLTVKFVASCYSSQMTPTPVFNLHLEKEITDQKKRSQNFKNTDIRTSLENAYLATIQSGEIADLKTSLFYFEFFSNNVANDFAMNYLANSLTKQIKQEDLILLDTYLKEKNLPEYKYRLYPFYFINKDFSHWNEWFQLAEQFAPDKIDLSDRLIYRITRRVESGAQFVRKWWVIGPFNNEQNAGFDKVYEPELKIDLSKKYQAAANQNVSWKKMEVTDFGYLDLFKEFDPNADVIAYAYKTFESNQDGKVLFCLGSDDGAALWVNGKEYFRKNIGRAARQCDDLIPVDVKKGKNEILVKISQGTGDWGLYLQIVDRNKIINL